MVAKTLPTILCNQAVAVSGCTPPEKPWHQEISAGVGKMGRRNRVENGAKRGVSQTQKGVGNDGSTSDILSPVYP